MKTKKRLLLLIIFVTIVWAGCERIKPNPEPISDLAAYDDVITNVTPGTVTIPILNNDLINNSAVKPNLVEVDIDLSKNGVQTQFVVSEEGTWSYNTSDGNLTFTPIDYLIKNPSPIKYRLIENSIGSPMEATVKIEYKMAPLTTIKVNWFIKNVMEDIYLWYNTLPNIDPRGEFDSEAYFDTLLYVDDKWSLITNDIVALDNSLKGKETSYGWSLAFGRFSNTKTVFALVEFVYPGTPADIAGLKRGDMIFKMNGANITDNNYMDLLNAASLSCTFGQYTEEGEIINTRTESMTAQELQLDPVLLSKVIERDGHKIGYLLYTQFINNYNSSLDDVFAQFKAQGINDLVIDLRYNPGGVITAAQHLCSSLAPASIVNSSATLVTYHWNDKYQQYWEQQNATNQLEVTFLNSVPQNMNLTKVYILTGSGTASASELTITGLKPYMDVVTVGETTYGKYTASFVLKPEDFYDDASYYNDFRNWGIMPIILRYANSQGVTDFKDGFTPDIPVDDDLFTGIPLGNVQEPLLKAAVEDITGIPIVAMKSARVKPHRIFDRGFSKFDVNKRELLIDNHELTPADFKPKKLSR
ncbi:MAG: hypothetical protein CR996_00640 [Draconibacterium sp.]|nr:MAG: hypothetical protein CR996_00640 [Draconibacterium sp.]PIF06725.1 MAG: hypothetical protein CSA36_00145 [Draconibacterium sp.]